MRALKFLVHDLSFSSSICWESGLHLLDKLHKFQTSGGNPLRKRES